MNLDRDQLAQTLRSVALPAMAGAAGGGALGAYASSQSNPQGELPSQRRHRILRNALIAASLGGATGAALPLGVSTLAKPYFGGGATGGPGMVDKGVQFGINEALPMGVGGLGYVAHKGALGRERDRTLGTLLGMVQKQPMAGTNEIKSIGELSHVMGRGDPAMTRHLVSLLMGNQPSMENLPNLFKATDILHEAGHPKMRLSDLQSMIGGGITDSPVISGGKQVAEQAHLVSPELRAAFMEHLGKGFDPVGKALSLSSRANELPGVAGQVGKHLTGPMSSLGELYARHARPGAADAARRFMGINPLGRLALLGGGVYGAHKLQQSLMGN